MVQPVMEPSVWRGEALSGSGEWVLTIDEAIQGDLDALASRAVERGMSCDNVELIGTPGSALARLAFEIRHALGPGRGFVLLRGLRTDGYSESELAMLYSCLGTCLGVPVSQSAEGDRLGHVIDRGLGDQGRYYTRGGQLEFHMDPVDVVGLLCLRTAQSGGASRIVSALAVHNTMARERPDLMALLYRGFHNARHPDGLPPTPHRVPVFAEGPRGMECYYLPVTIRQASEEGYPLSPEEREALACMAGIADRPALRLDMDFREGDIQFLNNRKILHARTDYVDPPDRSQWRHLLRLWLMMPDWPARPASMTVHSGDRSGGGVRATVQAD